MKVFRPVLSVCAIALAVAFCISPLLAAVTVTPDHLGDVKRWKITATGITNGAADSASFMLLDVPFLDEDNDINLPTQLVSFSIGTGDTVQTQIWAHYVPAAQTSGSVRTIARTDTSYAAETNHGTTSLANLAVSLEVVVTNQKATVDTSSYSWYLLIPSDD
jgi:hypothetical protein